LISRSKVTKVRKMACGVGVVLSNHLHSALSPYPVPSLPSEMTPDTGPATRFWFPLQNCLVGMLVGAAVAGSGTGASTGVRVAKYELSYDRSNVAELAANGPMKPLAFKYEPDPAPTRQITLEADDQEAVTQLVEPIETDGV